MQIRSMQGSSRSLSSSYGWSDATRLSKDVSEFGMLDNVTAETSPPMVICSLSGPQHYIELVNGRRVSQTLC